MAIGSTIYRAQLSIADMDRHYYGDHEMTIARHPSETDLRMMIRIAAFALNADERLLFTKGLCVEDEPELWLKNYSGEIELWIDMGQMDEKRVRKACGRSDEVIIYTYQEGSARAWFEQNRSKFSRFKNLKIIQLDVLEGALEALTERSMKLQCNIEDGILTLHSEKGDVTVTQRPWE